MPAFLASTFLSGAQPLISSTLADLLPDASVKHLDDGIILYKTSSPPKSISALRFFQNSFIILSFAENLDPADPLKSLIKHIREDETLSSALKTAIASKSRTYKLQASVENQLTALHPIQRQKLEKRLGEYGLHPSSSSPQCELWLMVRSEGYGFLGLRVPKHETYDQPLQKGELKQDLAYLLCLISQPKKTDTVLDPCAGSGAILGEWASSFPYQTLMMGDHDSSHQKDLQRIASHTKTITVGSWDAQTLIGISDASVDAIVTDPPWGKFAQDIDLPEFYRSMLIAFRRVIKKEGRVVLLMSREGCFEEILQSSSFKSDKVLDILVSGQKARIWLLYPK